MFSQKESKEQYQKELKEKAINFIKKRNEEKEWKAEQHHYNKIIREPFWANKERWMWKKQIKDSERNKLIGPEFSTEQAIDKEIMETKDKWKLATKSTSVPIKETSIIVDPILKEIEEETPQEEYEEIESIPIRRNKNQLGVYGDIESKPTEETKNIINTIRADGTIKWKDFSIMDVYKANMEEGLKYNPLPIEWRPHIK